MVTGYAVPGLARQGRRAWKALRHRTCPNHPPSLNSCRFVRFVGKKIRGPKLFRGFSPAKIVQGECNKVYFDCRAAAYLMQSYLPARPISNRNNQKHLLFFLLTSCSFKQESRFFLLDFHRPAPKTRSLDGRGATAPRARIDDCLRNSNPSRPVACKVISPRNPFSTETPKNNSRFFLLKSCSFKQESCF